MSVETIQTLLKKSFLFRDLDEKDLGKLSLGCHYRTVKAGDSLVAQGEKGRDLFLIIEGDCQVYWKDEKSDLEKSLRMMTAGQCFGELSLLTGGRRTASVRAATDGRLLVFSGDAFVETLKESPGMGLALCKSLGEYISAITQREIPVPYRRLQDFPDAVKYRKLIPPRVVQACGAVAVGKNERIVTVAAKDPHNMEMRLFLKSVLHPDLPDFVMMPDEDFQTLYNAVEFPEEEKGVMPSDQELRVWLPGTGPGAGISDFEKTETDAFLQFMLKQAVECNASDIHFEIRGDKVQARLRVDGLLFTPFKGKTIPSSLGGVLINRLKVLANLDTTQRQRPGDGVLTLYRGTRMLSARLSTMPSLFGETAVLRLLWDGQFSLGSLDSLVRYKSTKDMISKLFLQPDGLVLVSGATGMGKTTTLYAAIDMIWNKSPLVNIVTIEDPIDRQIDYATQIQVDANMGRTHATLLRGVLRQDPDIILVGEMRDTESASLALEAATTGHLVLSTLHNRRALESVTRLRSLNVESYLIGASLRGVISQCLLGINCPDCQQTISDPANDEEVKELFVLNILSPDDDPSVLRRSPGCEGCRKMGIKGRVAAFEIFVPSDATLRLIAGGKLIADIKSKLAPDELMPMEGYVRRLLLDGVVSPKEALDIFPHV